MSHDPRTISRIVHDRQTDWRRAAALDRRGAAGDDPGIGPGIDRTIVIPGSRLRRIGSLLAQARAAHARSAAGRTTGPHT